MDRKDFVKKSLQLGLCSGALFLLDKPQGSLEASSLQNDELARVKAEKEFIQNWLTDLLETIETELDEPTRKKLIAGCGRGCFRRHQFKQDIANAGKNDINKLIAAYEKNFEIWRDGDIVHVRYGEVSRQCYCPAAKFRPPKPNDLHCECTRSTHQTIFETALGRPIRVEVAESLRRGGKTCHFLVHLT